VRSPEFFVNGAIWGVVAVLVSWGLANGTLSWLDATLILAAVAWPFALFYCLRFSGLFGFILKLYAVAFPVALFFRYYAM
jgi:hypothetical protein